MSKQKFHHGDVVWVAEDLGPAMSHFTSGQVAVLASGGGGKAQYTLLFEGGRKSSWYEEHQLTLLEKSKVPSLEKTLTRYLKGAMYIALELDHGSEETPATEENLLSHKDINDVGVWCKTKEEALAAVEGCFYPPCTIVVPKSKQLVKLLKRRDKQIIWM